MGHPEELCQENVDCIYSQAQRVHLGLFCSLPVAKNSLLSAGMFFSMLGSVQGSWVGFGGL